ncbi:DNA repair protein RecN [Paracoccus sp. S-4012]|uniref:DNA repair protein RecN n=1 Tax=Paracoccus sp. S-4012 TaxID=2665648 RepID=UPI0012AF6AAD|nr:DNA repair protein RecN [Paracoccus sp. S-4012]MRX49056.1 DNA repair protein RecN [Paracoccus sp. S-4012]
MLRHLDIRDMLLIERQELEFGPGLNVLTGETGAGKSILLDALGFVLGWRGRADVVRQGAAQGEVTAVFALPPGHPAHGILAEAGLAAEDELVLRRTATPEGRKTAYVNDRRSSAEMLRALGESLVELHGQHDDRGLLNPRGHRALLDAFAGLDTAPVRAAWAARRDAVAGLAAAAEALASAKAEEEFLRHAVAELDRLAPQPGEDAELDTRRRGMQAAARFREDVVRALNALGSQGAEGAMIDASRWLEDAAEGVEGALEDPLAALGRALIELGEATSGIEAALRAMDFAPEELEAAEERLFAIRALARKHDTLPDDLAVLADDLRGRLERLEAGEGEVARLGEALAAAESGYERAADAATKARKAAALRLDAAMAQELAPLKLERARFETLVEPGEPGPDGRDAVQFVVATNPGAPAGPIDRIASGGELSRFLLALKVCLAHGSEPVTMIFDEIDRGVGGATADAVGRRLARIAEDAQVLVVTHAPQVAARGADHFLVAKSASDETTRTVVTPLAEAERVDEIARMLAGETVTAEARAAAEALLRG